MVRIVPDFIIIGAPKCGTTALYTYLKDHPDIFMPQAKEPHFFAQNLSDRYARIRNFEDYAALFKEAKNDQICGEASVLYYLYPEALQKIIAHNPDVKIIFMVRDPVSMIVSYHTQLLLNLEEDEQDFQKAWVLQEERKKGLNLPETAQDPDLLQYRNIASFKDHFKRILEIIPVKQILVLRQEALKEDPSRLYYDVQEFLKISIEERNHFPAVNEASSLKYSFLQKFLERHPAFKKRLKFFIKPFLPQQLMQKLMRQKADKKPLDPVFKKELEEFFSKDREAINMYFKYKNLEGHHEKTVA